MIIGVTREAAARENGLAVARTQHVVRGMNNCLMLFGDGKKTLMELVAALKEDRCPVG